MRQLFSGMIVVTFFVLLVSCGEKTEDKNGSDTTQGASKENASMQTLLDTGLVYELPVAVTLYPRKGMDTAPSDSINPLIVLPVGVKFGVFTIAQVGKTPWYAIRVFAGPEGGWNDVAGHPLDSLEIRSYMAEKQGLPGWINHRDIEGYPMRYSPYPRADSTKGKKQRK